MNESANTYQGIIEGVLLGGGFWIALFYAAHYLAQMPIRQLFH